MRCNKFDRENKDHLKEILSSVGAVQFTFSFLAWLYMWPYKELSDPVQIIVHMCFDQSV